MMLKPRKRRSLGAMLFNRALAPQAEGPGYEIRAAAGNAEVTEILIYDEIGFWGIMAADFVRDLQMVTTPKILVRLNSPGGDVFDGLAIFNALVAHPAEVQVHIDGLAASMASVIMLAGDTVTAAESAFVMIHNPWSIVIGDAAEMRQMADLLDKVGGQIVSLYAGNTGKDIAAIADWMSAETWFTAAEAKSAGFVDDVRDEPLAAPTPSTAASAAGRRERLRAFDLTAFRNPPKLTATPTLGGSIPAAETNARWRRLRAARLAAG